MFLDGAWLEHLAERGRRVPPWAWLSALSHSDENRLTALAGDERVNVPAELREWWDAVAFLAGEILDTARGLELSPERLQRTRLIPLELELAATDANGGDGMPRAPPGTGRRRGGGIGAGHRRGTLTAPSVTRQAPRGGTAERAAMAGVARSGAAPSSSNEKYPSSSCAKCSRRTAWRP